LLAPDGARLFDRPPRYQGGPQTHFQRAESASYFGREIGVMYMHAHLRYAEAMAHYGDAEAFFEALRRANPIAIRSVVPNAALRQANCYYSSSDAAFFDRYQASAHYDDVTTGKVELEGGWRIYSSGAGIATRLIHQHLLGFKLLKSALVVDPILPRGLDGLQAEMVLMDRPVTVVYRIRNSGVGPTEVNLNGTALDFEREHNAYRTGAAVVNRAEFAENLDVCENRLVVHLG
jgi:cellobiose phosphorylase